VGPRVRALQDGLIDVHFDLTRRGRRAIDRGRETKTLDGIVAAVRDGGSAVLVLRGETGVGKTALLDHAAASAAAAGVAVERVAGVEAELDLSFAALHQLVAPMLGGIDDLPAPRRAALETAFGLAAGGAPDRFLVGLAVLALLEAAAADGPLMSVTTLRP